MIKDALVTAYDKLKAFCEATHRELEESLKPMVGKRLRIDGGVGEIVKFHAYKSQDGTLELDIVVKDADGVMWIVGGWLYDEETTAPLTSLAGICWHCYTPTKETTV